MAREILCTINTISSFFIIMVPTPKEVVEKLLANTTNEQVLNELVASDATYVSLNYDNPTLKEIMPVSFAFH